jgi:hypothetical protein
MIRHDAMKNLRKIALAGQSAALGEKTAALKRRNVPAAF